MLAIAPGHTTATTQAGTARASVAIEVRDGARPKKKDAEWDDERRNDCADLEAAQGEEAQSASDESGDVTMSQAHSENHDNADGQALNESAQPAALRVDLRTSHKTVKTAARSKASSQDFYQSALVIDGNSADTFAMDAIKYNNDLGTTRFAAQEVAQDGHKNKHNLGSYNYNFTAPVLSLGGRGIGVNLALSYNSRLWNKDGSVMTFNYNRG